MSMEQKISGHHGSQSVVGNRPFLEFEVNNDSKTSDGKRNTTKKDTSEWEVTRKRSRSKSPNQKVTRKRSCSKSPNQKVTRKRSCSKSPNQKVTRKRSCSKSPNQKVTRKRSRSKSPNQKETRKLSRSQSPILQVKVEKKGILNFDIPHDKLGDYYCMVCDAHMNSEVMWESHIKGKRHIKNSRKGYPVENKYEYSNQEPVIQKELDEETKPIAGLEHLIENLHSNKPPTYHCFLCSANFTTSKLLIEHITGLKHRMAFLKAHDEEKYSLVKSSVLSKTFLEPIVQDLILKYEQEHGRGKISVRREREKSESSLPCIKRDDNEDTCLASKSAWHSPSKSSRYSPPPKFSRHSPPPRSSKLSSSSSSPSKHYFSPRSPSHSPPRRSRRHSPSSRSSRYSSSSRSSRRSSSSRSPRRSPSPRSSRHSPSPRSSRHSPPRRSSRHSPRPRSSRHSPPPRSSRHSPPPRSSRHSPPPRSSRHSPPPRSSRQSPPPRSSRHSPPPRSTRYSPPKSARMKELINDSEWQKIFSKDRERRYLERIHYSNKDKWKEIDLSSPYCRKTPLHQNIPDSKLEQAYNYSCSRPTLEAGMYSNDLRAILDRRKSLGRISTIRRPKVDMIPVSFSSETNNYPDPMLRLFDEMPSDVFLSLVLRKLDSLDDLEIYLNWLERFGHKAKELVSLIRKNILTQDLKKYQETFHDNGMAKVSHQKNLRFAQNVDTLIEHFKSRKSTHGNVCSSEEYNNDTIPYQQLNNYSAYNSRWNQRESSFSSFFHTPPVIPGLTLLEDATLLNYSMNC